MNLSALRSSAQTVLLLAAIAAGALATTPASAQPPEVLTGQLDTTRTQTLRLPYWLARPTAPQPNADPNAETAPQTFPLILFLHGLGESGSDLQAVTRQGLPRYLTDQTATYPAFVAAPQCPQGSFWDLHAPELIALLDHLLETQPIDPDRVYLTGLSMGGYGAWHLAARHPDRFAAVVPICGGTHRIDAMRIAKAALPLWNFHGNDDDIVPAQESQDAMRWLHQHNHPNAQFTFYDHIGHNSWDTAYAETQLWTWLFAQNRSDRHEPANIPAP